MFVYMFQYTTQQCEMHECVVGFYLYALRTFVKQHEDLQLPATWAGFWDFLDLNTGCEVRR